MPARNVKVEKLSAREIKRRTYAPDQRLGMLSAKQGKVYFPKKANQPKFNAHMRKRQTAHEWSGIVATAPFGYSIGAYHKHKAKNILRKDNNLKGIGMTPVAKPNTAKYARGYKTPKKPRNVSGFKKTEAAWTKSMKAGGGTHTRVQPRKTPKLVNKIAAKHNSRSARAVKPQKLKGTRR